MGFSYAYACVLLYLLMFCIIVVQTGIIIFQHAVLIILQSTHCHQCIKGIKLREFFTHSLISTVLACSRHVILFIVK